MSQFGAFFVAFLRIQMIGEPQVSAWFAIRPLNGSPINSSNGLLFLNESIGD
jgi:hypothetical protein